MGSSQKPAYHTGASESSFLHVPLSLGTVSPTHIPSLFLGFVFAGTLTLAVALLKSHSEMKMIC